jgi:hypothetical protein
MMIEVGWMRMRNDGVVFRFRCGTCGNRRYQGGGDGEW